MLLFEPIYVYAVRLENGELVHKYTSTKGLPQVGEKLILDIDQPLNHFTVLNVDTDSQDGNEFYVLRVSADLINT